MSGLRAAWNTGCLYTQAGQRIAAEVLEGGKKILFVDIDRMIDGVFPVVRPPTDAYALQQLVTTAYDFHNYEGTRHEEWRQRVALVEYARAECPVLKREARR